MGNTPSEPEEPRRRRPRPPSQRRPEEPQPPPPPQRRPDLSDTFSEVRGRYRRLLMHVWDSQRERRSSLEVLPPNLPTEPEEPGPPPPPPEGPPDPPGILSELRDLRRRLLMLELEKKAAKEERERRSQILSELVSDHTERARLESNPFRSIRQRRSFLSRSQRLLILESKKKEAKEKERERLLRGQLILELDPAVRPTFESIPMRKRSSSLEVLPPNLSELRVVLLGNSSSERMKVKDLLLSASEGVTEISSNDYWKYEFKIKERDVHVINPKDLLGPDVSQAEVEEDVQTAQRLSAPGAHVLLLVLQPEDFTEDQKEKLCSVLRLFGERSFDHSLILISTPREESPGFMEEFRKHPPLKDLIRMCKYRYLWFKDLEVEELLTRFDQIVKENDGEHLKP